MLTLATVCSACVIRLGWVCGSSTARAVMGMSSFGWEMTSRAFRNANELGEGVNVRVSSSEVMFMENSLTTGVLSGWKFFRRVKPWAETENLAVVRL